VSIEAALYSYLSGVSAVTALVSTRIYPGQAPEATAKPYIVHHRISGRRFPSVTGPSGMVRARIQIDIVAATRASALAVFEVLRNNLDGWRQATMVSEYVLSINLDDERSDIVAPTDGADPGTHRMTTDWIVLYGESGTAV